MRHLLILACLLFVTGAMADEADFDLKSKKANIAIEKYQATIKKAKAVEKRNRVDLILALEAALKYERTEGELDEAIKIRDAIKLLKKGAKALKNGARPADRGKTSKKPLVPDGVYRADYGHYPWVFEYHVKGSRVSCPEVHNDDGHSEPRNWRGKLRPLGENRVAVNWVHGIVPVLEIWTITDSHILIQQWTGNDDRSKLPRHLAVIWLDKK